MSDSNEKGTEIVACPMPLNSRVWHGISLRPTVWPGEDHAQRPRRHSSRWADRWRHPASEPSSRTGSPGTTSGHRLVLALTLLIPGLSASLRAADTFSSVYISEFMADAQRGLADEQGEVTGWIELYNGGTETVNLNGWFLTDNAGSLTKWRLPGVSLLADMHLVVFASGKDRTHDLAHLHSNFVLDKKGGYLALVDPARKVVSEFAAYPRQSADASYGSVRGEPSTRGYLARPTPGKPNMSQGPGFAPEVEFSQSSGTFTKPVTLRLSAPDPAASIHYTLDGQLPTLRSPVYRDPLVIAKTSQVRARAYREGLLPGLPRSETLLLLHKDVQEFTSRLPVLIMDTLGDGATVSRRYSFVHLSFFEPANGRTTLTSPASLTTRGEFRTRGSTSAGMPQQGFAVHFLDEFNDEQDRSPLGLPADSDWVLYAPNAFEPVMIHNPFIHQLSRDMGRYSPRTRFVEVFLVNNSGPVQSAHYHGVYVLEEKIKVGKHRVNIDPLRAEDLTAPQVRGGYLLKIDRLGPGESGLSAAGVAMVHVDPDESVLKLPQRAPQRKYLDEYFKGFDRALNGPKWKEPDAGYLACIDVSSWIDYHVLEVLSGNVDALALSTHLQVHRNGKIVFGPHWDFDRALGSTDGRDHDPRQWNTGPYFDTPWWNRLFTDPDFWQRWVDRWQELRLTHFSLGNMNGLIDRLADEVREAQPRQVRRWNLQPRGGSYQSEVDLMKRWLAARVEFIDGQLCQPPTLSHKGGKVLPGTTLTLSAPADAMVYYTTDGSDPRLSQGAISPKAVAYRGPIRLADSMRIIARGHDAKRRQTGGPPISTPWSGPVEAKFVISDR